MNIIDSIINSQIYGGTVGVVPSNIQAQITACTGAVKYIGSWDANTNTPTLTSVPVEKGIYYIVSVGGIQFGLTFNAKDWIVSNGTEWQRVDNYITAEEIGLGNVDNTSDVTKMIVSNFVDLDTSDKTIVGAINEHESDLIALDGRVDILTPKVTTLENKTSNIDNTSDLNKPISTPTQTALNDKTSKGGYTGTSNDLYVAIQSIGDASPKGTYATLLALQTAYPTGTTGIYVVTADGNWYYWNGSAWTSGGVYQATAISENSVTENKMANDMKKIQGGVAKYDDVYGVGLLPTNLNTNEGNLNPLFLGNITETAVIPKVEVIPDLESPVKDLIPNMRKIYKTTASGSTLYINRPFLPSLYEKPTVISYGFWIKDSDVNSVYATNRLAEWWIFQSSKYVSWKFDLKTLITSENNTVPVTKNINVAGLIDSFDVVAICLHKKDGYSYIKVDLTSIVWNVNFTSNFTTVYWYWQFTSVKTQLETLELNISNLTLLYDSQIENGYYIYGDKGNVKQYPVESSIQNQVYYIEKDIENQNFYNKKLKIIKKGEYIYIRTSWNNFQDLIQKIYLKTTDIYNGNNLVEFDLIGLVNKTLEDVEIPNTSLLILKYGNDDIAPANYNKSYIGANHGCDASIKITANAHGKTFQDVGSEWLDNLGRKFYILRIIDVNNLLILSENIATDETWDFYTSVNGTSLIHSLNATNTSTINFTAQVNQQLYPSIKNETRKLFLDKKEIGVNDNGIFVCDNFKILNSYDINSPLSVLNYVKTNVGSLTELILNNNSIEKDTRFNIEYNFNDFGACTIKHNISVNKKILLTYFGGVQSMPNVIGVGGTLHQYVKNVNMFNSYDFENIQNVTTLPSDVKFEKTKWKDLNNPPSDFVQFSKTSLGQKFNNFGFAVGYNTEIGYGNPNKRKDYIDDSFFINTTKKQYPKIISSNNNVFVSDFIESNNNFDFIAYRSPINYNLDSEATSIFYYTVDNDIYLHLDYHTNVDKWLSLPESLISKKITVVDKNINFEIQSDLVSYDGIKIKVINNYGYAVLKLN